LDFVGKTGVEGKFKPEKTAVIKSTSTEHDALSKLAKIKIWIEKYHKVRVVIQQSKTGDINKLYKLSENMIRECEGKIEQKVTASSQIRFVVIPTKLPKNFTTGNDRDEDDDDDAKEIGDEKLKWK